MIGLKQMFNLSAIFLALSLFSGSNAMRPISELNSALSAETPFYQVPEGELEDVVHGVKDYHMIMLITTANEKYNCAMCKDFDPVFVKVVNAIYRKYPEIKNSVAFTRVEAADDLPYLQTLGINSVPQVWGFPNSVDVLGEDKFNKIAKLLELQKESLVTGEHFITPDWYDLDQAGMEHYIFQLSQGDSWDSTVNALASFITKTTKFDIKAALVEGQEAKGFEWSTVVQTFSILLILFKFIQQLRKKMDGGVKIWADKRLYCYISLVLIVFSISGFHFTAQRQSPFISQKEGKILWIAPQANTQFGSEVIISIGLQIVFAILLTYLIDFNFVFGTPVKEILICCAGMALLFMLLIGVDIYHVKNMSYPFHFLNLF